MTESELDIASQSGFAALVDAGTDTDEPFIVHGVAIGEGDITQGASGKRTYWPRSTLESAAEGLAGKKIVDDSEHDDLEATQPPVSAILGEVTKTAYKDGVGVVFEGEIDDSDIAALVENGRVDVSPALFRELGDYDDEREAKPATGIQKWRDLSVVAEGAAPSNSIQPGAAAALQAEALQAAFDDADDDDVAESQSDESAESDTDSTDDDPTAARTVDNSRDTMELTDAEEALVQKARSLEAPAVFETENTGLADSLAQVDEPGLVEKAEYETTQKRVAEVRNRLAETLLEQSDLRADTVSALTFEALWDEFTDHGDDIPDIAVLTQTPEAGGIGEDEDEGPTADDVDEIESMLNRADMMERHAPSHAESLREQAADLAEVDRPDEIDLEVL